MSDFERYVSRNIRRLQCCDLRLIVTGKNLRWEWVVALDSYPEPMPE